MSDDRSSASASTATNSPGSEIAYDRFLDCVHCGLCTSACPTYLETGDENDSPRGRIYLMRSVVDGRVELSERVQRHLDLCLDCRACETACPSGVQYGRLIEPFRVDLQQTDTNGAAPGLLERMLLYGLFPHVGRMRAALLPARLMQKTGLTKVIDVLRLPALFPRLLRRMYEQLPELQSAAPPLPITLPAKGPRRAKVGLFTGCVSEAMFSHVNRATARVLQENGCDVVIPRNQNCCGAIHYHSGAAEPAIELALKNNKAFPDDIDAIVVNVAGCGAMLKDYGHVAEEVCPESPTTVEQLRSFTSRVKDVSEFLTELGPIAPTGVIKLRATYHDACHLCHAQSIRDQPRELLSLIPGLELIPLSESEICCGAAGSYNLTQPEMADRLGQRKTNHILDTGAEAVVVGNVGCSMQIQARLRRDGHPLWVVHPVELLDLSYRQAAVPDGVTSPAV